MAESSWPSPSNGRVVDDASYEKLGMSYGAAGGVVGDFTSPQLVYGDSTGMQVKVGADRYALVRGHEWWSGSTIFTVAIGANSSGSTRVDLVVLRLSRTTWDVNITVIAGTPGSGAPSPTQNLGTTGLWDLPLATVTVASGASSIAASNVTYVAPHLASDGTFRTPTTAALSYVPQPYDGLRAWPVDTRMPYVYSGVSSAWRSGTPAPMVHLVQQTAQTGWTTATSTAVTFGTGSTVIDTGSFHSESSNTSRVVIGKQLGWWQIGACYCPQGNSNTTYARGIIYKNGVANPVNGAFGGQVLSNAAGFVGVAVPVTLVQATASTDYIELYGQQHATSTPIGTAVSSGFVACTLTAIWRGTYPW